MERILYDSPPRRELHYGDHLRVQNPYDSPPPTVHGDNCRSPSYKKGEAYRAARPKRQLSPLVSKYNIDDDQDVSLKVQE